MATFLDRFETIVRRAKAFDARDGQDSLALHPFDRRNIHPRLPPKVRKLFDDGHYAEATFEAFKFIDKVVQKHAKVSESGMKLMMQVFDEAKPLLQLTALSNSSEIDEQKGYRFLFSGAVMAIRNPRGHEVNISDDPDTCLDHLAFASLLLRRLEQSGFA
ncbi:TIGR02391 family protein [Thiomonas sp.]|uniref:Conserved hypothetical protein CHP02391 domain-containing protein n=1 Tax=mine drainage metagenome TaxID=410659 RepID=E6PN89_9ZZZZ